MLERASHTDTPTKEVRARVEISTELSDDHRVPPPAPPSPSRPRRRGGARRCTTDVRSCVFYGTRVRDTTLRWTHTELLHDARCTELAITGTYGQPLGV